MGEENERLVTRLEKEKNEKMEMGIKDWSPYILGIKGFFLLLFCTCAYSSSYHPWQVHPLRSLVLKKRKRKKRIRLAR